MGARGPAPTPTAHLKARNSWRADERKNEPMDVSASPDMPIGMPKAAQDHWRLIVPQLIARGTLSKVDLGMLAAMCCEWAEYIGAIQAIEKLKKSKQTFKGHMIDHPRAIKNGAYDRYKQAADRFGLSPAAKARVQANPPEKPKAVEQHTGLPPLRIAK